MLSLRNVTVNDWQLLYDMLKERTPGQSISHKKMPTVEEHIKFIESKPYPYWWIIFDNGVIGNAYLTDRNEIGVHIIGGHRGKKYGSRVVDMIMRITKKPYYLANINPTNKVSIGMFKKKGFECIQWTYKLEVNNG